MFTLIIQQSRGPNLEVVHVSSPIVPCLGETVFVDGTEISGCVCNVQHTFVYKPDAPKMLAHVTVTLAGWKSSFKKD